MGATPRSQAARLLDRVGRVGLHEAALIEIRAEIVGRVCLEPLVDRAVREVPARWRAVAEELDPTSTLRAPMRAAADELEAVLDDADDATACFDASPPGVLTVVGAV